MAISGIFFILTRIFEIIILIPILGMLAYFVHGFTAANELTPTYVLVLFITSVLAAAWAIVTTIAYLSARHSAIFVALVDLAFVATLIAGVVVLRGIDGSSCSNFTATNFWIHLGTFGYYGQEAGSKWASNPSKTCNMLKASFALGIIAIILFFFTFLLALLVAHHHRNDNERVVTKTEYVQRRHHSGNRRSSRGSQDNRGNYDNRGSYDRGYDNRRNSSRRSQSNRRTYV